MKMSLFRKRGVLSFLIVFLLLILSFAAFSHEGEEETAEEKMEKERSLTLDEQLKNQAVTFVLLTAAWVTAIVLISIFYKNKPDKLKAVLFLLIVLPVILTTGFVAGSTIYLNVISETKGPVHWHADYEIWNCNQKIELVNPKGLSNKIGTEVFHEHNDDRIHAEGVITDLHDASLHSFFNVVGGKLIQNSLVLPTENGLVNVKNGELCDGIPSKLQVFLYKISNPDDKGNLIYAQQKLEDFEDYVLSPYSYVPPGDCIIIEFSPDKEKTGHICETYKIAIQKGELSGS